MDNMLVFKKTHVERYTIGKRYSNFFILLLIRDRWKDLNVIADNQFKIMKKNQCRCIRLYMKLNI